MDGGYNVHTSVHTSPAGPAGRPRKRFRRAKSAREIAGTGGLPQIRSRDRSRRRAARTPESAPPGAPSELRARLPVTAVRDPTDGSE